MLSKLRSGAGAVLFLLALPCSPALAEQPAPVSAPPLDDPKLVYEQAARAYEEHRYSDAIRLFQRADALRPNPAFDFNVGLAFEDMGDPARALASYRSYVRRLPNAPDRVEVDVRIERLERRLERAGVQQVTVLSEPLGARVTIDGAAVGVTPWTGEIAKGFHTLGLQLDGFESEERTFDLPPARAIDVPVTLKPRVVETSQTPVEEAPPPVEPPCEGACVEAVRGSTWLIAGVGVVSMGGALALELQRADRESAARAEPNQVAASRLFDDAFRAQKWATALALTGGALIVTGGVLAWLDIDEAKNPESVAWSLGCTPTECVVGAGGSF